jgi:hypothetical protein
VVRAVSAATNVSFSDSVSAKNGSDGVASISFGAVTNVMVRNSTIAFNSNNGLSAVNNANLTLRVTRSTITGNGTGWSASFGGVLLSYADNNIDGNTQANTEPPGPLTYK